MTKKAKVTVWKADGTTKLSDFYSKTLTSTLNKLMAGTVVKLSIQENDFGDQFVGDYVVKGLPGEPEEPVPPEPEQPPVTPPPVEPPVTPPVEPPVTAPPQPTGEVLYDSTVNSKLHDGKVRTVDAEGAITPNGLGCECRASGSPKLQVNADQTFSLLCGVGHGRFYLYCLNYDATLEIEAAWWKGDGDCSLKMQSRHNEGGDCANRFGGYGLAIDRANYNAKSEICHNEH